MMFIKCFVVVSMAMKAHNDPLPFVTLYDFHMNIFSTMIFPNGNLYSTTNITKKVYKVSKMGNVS